MEFLRFGSSIPGSYWGCCAMCIIQNFKVDPATKASIEVVDGDGGIPIQEGSGTIFYGQTYEEIFRSRLRAGTFNSRDMPNHGFLAILTESQIRGGVGAKWLKILKEEGFEFIRTVDNSVYSGSGVMKKGASRSSQSHNRNYVFGLFRNIGSSGYVEDPFAPPQEWLDLGSSPVPEVWQVLAKEDRIKMAAGQAEYHLERWEAKGPTKFYNEKELEAAGVPITYAGQRSKYPQESKSSRKQKQDAEAKKTDKAKVTDPFA